MSKNKWILTDTYIKAQGLEVRMAVQVQEGSLVENEKNFIALIEATPGAIHAHEMVKLLEDHDRLCEIDRASLPDGPADWSNRFRRRDELLAKVRGKRK